MSVLSTTGVRRRRLAWIAGLAVAVLGVGLAAHAGLRASTKPTQTMPSASFELSPDAFAGVTARTVVTRGADGVVRERLSHGLPLDASADFTVILQRGGRPVADVPATRAGLTVLGPIADLPVTITGATRTAAARLGPVKLVPLSVGTEAGRKSCLGFVAPLPNAPSSSLSGWVCAALGTAATDAMVIHLIDHLRPRADADMAATAVHPFS